MGYFLEPITSTMAQGGDRTRELSKASFPLSESPHWCLQFISSEILTREDAGGHTLGLIAVSWLSYLVSHTEFLYQALSNDQEEFSNEERQDPSIEIHTLSVKYSELLDVRYVDTIACALLYSMTKSPKLQNTLVSSSIEWPIGGCALKLTSLSF